MMNVESSALSHILNHLQFQAKVFLYADFCGQWAVDSSGEHHVPFHLLVKGNGWLHVDAEQPATPLSAGTLVLFPHDKKHVISNLVDEVPSELINNPLAPQPGGPITSILCGYFEFKNKSIWPLLDGLPETIVIRMMDSGGINPCGVLIQLMIAELEQAAQGMDVVINQLAYVLFIHILRVQMNNGLDSSMLTGLADSKIGQALNFIHEKPGYPWTIDELAVKVGMSRSSFYHRFKQLMGMAPMRYIAQWRMQEAANLLERSDLSVAIIAEQSGYASEVAFRKAFRAIMGEPPGAVRRKAKAEAP